MQIIDYVAVEDVGRIINPATLQGQVTGALVQGLGGAFLEHFVYDEHGQLLTTSFADYLMPSASDFPNIRVFVDGEDPSPINPLGAKGGGRGRHHPGRRRDRERGRVGAVVARRAAARTCRCRRRGSGT